MRSLVIGEWENGAIVQSTRCAVTAALNRDQPVDILMPAMGANAAADIAGIDRVLSVSSDDAAAFLPETLSAQLKTLASEYSLIVASHRSLGRSVLPRAAALVDGAFLADVIDIDASGRFVRGMYAGSVIASVEATARIAFATIRSSSFAPAGNVSEPSPIIEIEPVPLFTRTRLLEQRSSDHPGRDLSNARLVVSGGRGLASQSNMDKLGKLAENMGAALGASRAAVDAGYAPNSAQIGQTGKTVAPDVYFAFGISGAIQHLAGMKDSKIIVAVNKDPDAPIFSVADYGIVGDLFQVLGELESYVQKQSTQ